MLPRHLRNVWLPTVRFNHNDESGVSDGISTMQLARSLRGRNYSTFWQEKEGNVKWIRCALGRSPFYVVLRQFTKSWERKSDSLSERIDSLLMFPHHKRIDSRFPVLGIDPALHPFATALFEWRNCLMCKERGRMDGMRFNAGLLTHTTQWRCGT